MNRLLQIVTVLAVGLANLAPAGAAPTTIYTFNGDDAEDGFGWSVSDAGDVNGDGRPDLIVGARYDDNNGYRSGSARVLSGMNGSTLYTFNGDSEGDQFGFSVSGAGDVNGDGRADLIVGTYRDDNNGTWSGSARVFSGMDGSTLYTFNGDSAGDFFGTVSGAGDVNGDGRPDLIVGALYDDNNGYRSGSARVFSGMDGSTLYTFNGDSAGDYFGSVSGAGDVNGDGRADLIVGAWGDDNNGSKSGSARVLSGIDGSTLYTFNGDSADDRFGSSVSGAGDVNGDGRPDLIVGAWRDDNNGTNAGSARVLSGIDGSTLYTLNGDSAGDGFGYPVSGAGDVNGDGRPDLIVGARLDDNNGGNSGSARVVSGIDGSTLYTFNGDSAGDQFGRSVSGAGDVNGDGFADLIVGAPGDDNNGSDSGSARVVTVNGVYDWQGISSDPGEAANWRLMNTTATPDWAPAGRDVVRIGPAANHPLNSGTIDIARIDVLDGGTLQNAPGASIVCPAINLSGLLTGSGTVGTVNLGDGGTLAPGGSSGKTVPVPIGTGTIGADDTTFGPGGLFELQINDFAGTAGDTSLGWDLLSVTGSLTLTATADNPLVIDLVSLTAAQTPGPADNFDNMQSYSLPLVATTGGIFGFDPEAFFLDASSLQNDLGGGTFWIGHSGNDLHLNFAPIPEPSTLAMAAMGLLGLAFYAWRRRRAGGS